MNNKKANVIVKSHPDSLITIIPIDSSDFRHIFRTEKPVITGCSANPTGFDFYSYIVVLQATICDNYAIIEYMKKVDYLANNKTIHDD